MKKHYIALVLGVLLVAAYLSTMSSSAMQKMQSGMMAVLSPFLRTGNAVQQQLGSVGQGLKTLAQLDKENVELREKNKELQTTNNLLREIEAENNRLRVALQYRERSVFKLLPAKIIARDASAWWNTFKINRGFEDGVESDQPVLTDIGLVGKTTTVSKSEAIVVLITDETCRVGAKVEGTREQGILSGMRFLENPSAGQLQLNFLAKNAPIKPEMKVFTAGVSNGVFPAGILLGTVKEFRVRPLDGQAVVEPAVDLASLEDVFVVVGVK